MKVNLPKYHIDREDLSSSITTRIQKNDIIQICGPLGIGKTTAVKGYFKSLKPEEKKCMHFAYIDGRALAKKLEIDYEEQVEQNDLPDIVAIDEVDNISRRAEGALLNYLNQYKCKLILISTEKNKFKILSDVSIDLDPLIIPPMNSAEIRELIEEYRGVSENPEIQQYAPQIEECSMGMPFLVIQICKNLDLQLEEDNEVKFEETLRKVLDIYLNQIFGNKSQYNSPKKINPYLVIDVVKELQSSQMRYYNKDEIGSKYLSIMFPENGKSDTLMLPYQTARNKMMEKVSEELNTCLERILGRMLSQLLVTSDENDPGERGYRLSRISVAG